MGQPWWIFPFLWDSNPGLSPAKVPVPIPSSWKGGWNRNGGWKKRQIFWRLPWENMGNIWENMEKLENMGNTWNILDSRGKYGKIHCKLENQL